MVADPDNTDTGIDWNLLPDQMTERCCGFLSQTVAASGAAGVVVGLSGGIDSAVAAALAVRALGADHVLGVFMPYTTSQPESLIDAKMVATALGIRTELVPVSGMVDAYLEHQPQADQVRRGNIMARSRMIVLYDLSARDRTLVLGTGNRTEALLGYTTMFGDNACALNPIGQLYKTEVRSLAAHLELPDVVRTKKPSADLWAGQSDEDEFGFTYAEADHLLHHMVDEQLEEKQLRSLGFHQDLIATVSQRVQRMRFKRVLAPVAGFPGRRDPDDDGGVS